MAGGMSILRALSPLAAILSSGGGQKDGKRKGRVKPSSYKRGGKVKRAKRHGEHRRSGR